METATPLKPWVQNQHGVPSANLVFFKASHEVRPDGRGGEIGLTSAWESYKYYGHS